MATTVKEGNFIYRINPDKPTELKEPRWGVTAGVSSADVMEPRSLTLLPRAVTSS